MADFRKDRDQAERIQMKATRVARKTDQTDCYLSFNYIFSFSNYTSSTCEQGTVLCSLWYCTAVAPFLLIVFMNNTHGRGGCYWRLQGHQEKAEKAEFLDIWPHCMFRMRSSSDLFIEREKRKLQVSKMGMDHMVFYCF